ncbi:unnamed protein product [Clonostachys rosea]|uniref:F-box domain-containing protein n=1 Tax=Bionectria ochroleuca TaxID=29856 RepID=A0ABY6UGL6_BIOOC|nr:unnamed protein product [Clonostachys rosea]
MEPPSFLSIPPDIRKLIYLFASLVKPCPVTIIPLSRSPTSTAPGEGEALDEDACHYKLRRQRKQAQYNIKNEPDCLCPAIPKQLLLVCKLVHAEVQEVLYKENKFVVRAYGGAEGLDILGSLSTNAIRSLRHLVVRLNTGGCIRGHANPSKNSRCQFCHNVLDEGDPVMRSDGRSELTIHAWENICPRLSSIVPGNLHLEFICDVGDAEVAKRVLKPLDSLPRLRECVIRLGRQPDAALLSLARSTATRLKTGRAEPQGFRFFSLPAEVRFNILQHTNLGPGGDFLPEFGPIHVSNGKFHQRHLWAGGLYDDSRRHCCFECSFTKLHFSCPFYHTAYSPTCKCRRLPLELFHVNRQMRTEASKIFYSTNKFVFRSYFNVTQAMLEKIAPEYLKELRCLEFEIYGFQTMTWRRHAQEWDSLMTFINDNCDPSRLLIKISIKEKLEFLERYYEMDFNMHLVRELYDGYVSLARTVKTKLQGLRDFHLSLGVLYELEPVLEKYVMGEAYDSKNGNQHSKAAHGFELYPDAREEFRAIPPWHREL